MFRQIVFLGLLSWSVTSVADTLCSANNTPVNFGVYDDLYYDLDTISGGVTVSCTVVSAPTPPSSAISYTIKFSSGNAPSFAPRQMKNGAFTMNYNLYVNATRSVAAIWGDGLSGTQIVNGSVTQLNSVGITRSGPDHIVYGRIPKGQGGLGVGNYTDSLVVTLTF
jgi:spore coat protein U-like protein